MVFTIISLSTRFPSTRERLAIGKKLKFGSPAHTRLEVARWHHRGRFEISRVATRAPPLSYALLWSRDLCLKHWQILCESSNWMCPHYSRRDRNALVKRYQGCRCGRFSAMLTCECPNYWASHHAVANNMSDHVASQQSALGTIDCVASQESSSLPSHQLAINTNCFRSHISLDKLVRWKRKPSDSLSDSWVKRVSKSWKKKIAPSHDFYESLATVLLMETCPH